MFIHGLPLYGWSVMRFGFFNIVDAASSLLQIAGGANFEDRTAGVVDCYIVELGAGPEECV